VTGDFPVDEMRRWVAELVGPGLDRPVANLMIATYALLADRAWVHHGVPAEAPDLDRMGAGDALRAQELPGADEFVAARSRAASLFGITVPEPLFARNVQHLATQTRQRIAELENDVVGAWHALDRHADDLGVSATANRLRTARAAADLLARLSGITDATAFARALAADDGQQVSDQVLGAAVVSAPAVRRALDGVQWQLLASVRNLHHHPKVGDRAARLTGQVADAAAAEQFETDLAAVLGRANTEAIGIVSDATDVPPPPVTPAPPVAPPSPSPPTSPGRRAERREITATDLAAVIAEIERAVRADPDARYEVTWRALDGTSE
jgi:hypothetical protein